MNEAVTRQPNTTAACTLCNRSNRERTRHLARPTVNSPSCLHCCSTPSPGPGMVTATYTHIPNSPLTDQQQCELSVVHQNESLQAATHFPMCLFRSRTHPLPPSGACQQSCAKAAVQQGRHQPRRRLVGTCAGTNISTHTGRRRGSRHSTSVNKRCPQQFTLVASGASVT